LLPPDLAGQPEGEPPLPQSIKSSEYTTKWLRRRANIRAIARPRLLSVSEAAAELKASDAYVRRLLLKQRLYGIKVGPVWAILPEDLEEFKRMRRRPGRPPKAIRVLAPVEQNESFKRRRKAG
jgi:excisionase family DNA binding protein